MMRSRKYSVALSVLIGLLFGLLVSSRSSRLSAGPEYVLEFDGLDDRVSFGPAPELGASKFTLELWFVRTGTGTTTTTGTGGIPSAIPLLTKGRGQADGSNLDMNYFLGIESTTRVLAADFEDMHNGGNHPVRGRTAICDNIWYHAAATYDGTTWRLYLNGDLEAELVVPAPLSPNQRLPRADSIQHAGLATAMTSDPGTPQGFFKGRMHEARIWNVARNQADIRNTMGEAMFAAQPGLIGRWGLDEGSGTTVTNSAGVPNGTVGPAAAPPAWSAGGSNFESGLVPGADVLQLTGTATAKDFVTFGPATSTLGAATFTIETWFSRSGPGVGASTGTGGLAGAIPLVTKGRSQGDNANIDMNYFLGIDATNVLAADFEEAPTATASGGQNHPIRGVTPLAAGWNHAAVTYDGANLQLYLNGVPDGPPTFVGRAPRADSIQHAALGTALDSNGVADGFFAGSLDEARIWNYARSATQIAAGATREIPNASGLLARWSFNDCCGRVIDSTGHVAFGPSPVVGGPIQGATLQGTGWRWAARGDTTLSATVNQPPVVEAGADLTVTLPAFGVLAGSITDDGVDTGSLLSSAWSLTSGPGLVFFGDPTAPGSRVDFSATGTYVVRLTADDGELSAGDTVTIEVDGVANQAPVVEAGADQTITLPADAVALSVVISDDGLPGPAITAQWSTMSGPGLVTFTDATAFATTATFASEGAYVLQITASDGMLTASDTLSITVNPSAANTAVRLGGTDSYVTFGPAPQLGASAFTLEAWIRRDGAGVATSTGTNGGVTAVPIVTRGMSETDGGTVDMNYFLGISPATGKLAADFEDTATGGNHPIDGTAAIPADGSWHHVAASYDGTTWRLYLDGNLDAMRAVGAFTPRFDSIQHAAIGTALNSLGVVTAGRPVGRFHGVIDEVRIWNYARSGAQIVSGTNREIPSAIGLLARWGLDEAAGTMVTDSTDAAVIGTIVGTNYSWVSGAHVTGGLNAAPVVDAGPDQDLTLAVGMLIGSATDDGLTGTLVTTEWRQVSGPGVAMFGAPAAAITTVDFMAPGTYVLQLTASDGELSASDDVTIVVGGVINEPPVVEAGGDQTIFLPANVAALSGTATDDGVPEGSLTTVWSKVSGPGSVAFANAAASATTATFSMHGTYVLRLSATDGVLGGNDTLTITVSPDPANQALQFGGTNAFVSLGPAPGLGAARFTLETWFRRDGAGVATMTGSGGVIAIPLVTKGMAEVDNSNRDMNYFLGIRESDGVLAADFEDTATGLNHPVTGTTPILAGPAWHHAAATYDGTNWRLYLDGQLEREMLNVGATPRADSIQHAALGTALNSTGSSGTQTQGFFNGAMDESRIWNYARSAEQISRGRRVEIAAPTPGLLGRWGMNEATGTSVANSAGLSLHGVVIGSDWSWVEGAPFTSTNQAPAAVDDTVTTAEDTAATIAVLANDSDADGDGLSLALVGSPVNGTATANADGTIAYTPSGNFTGPDSFSYAISDGLGATATATVHVTITEVNDAPVAADDAATTSEDTPVAIAVLANDADGDSTALTPIVVTGPVHGSLAIADGSITYAPAANFRGTDRFTYTANDGAADSGIATVMITVEPVNDVPVVASDSYSVDEDGTLHVADAGVLGNDTDADGDILSATLVSGPGHGGLMLNAEGSFIYTPDAGFSGADSFTYLANDGTVDSNVATVMITVNEMFNPPVAAADSYSSEEDQTLLVAAPGVLVNDSDNEGKPLTAVLASGPGHGTLTFNSNGSFSYKPAVNFAGIDTFTYRASNGTLSSAIATVTITISATNDAPIAVMDRYMLDEDTTLTIAAPGLLANDVDVDSSNLTVVKVTNPLRGTLTLNANGSFTYTPRANYHGPDGFLYRVTDETSSSRLALVILNVRPVSEAPAR
jgi:VCBS repeat-containing protein